MTQKHRNMLEVFNMWIWRRIITISWTQKVTNQEVLNIDTRRKEYDKQYPPG